MKTEIKLSIVTIGALAALCFIGTGNEKFKTVKIGNQQWMAENLDVDHYRNGDIIPQVQDSAKWRTLKTGAWCYYNFKTGEHTVKGKLYNGYALTDPRGLIPAGWAVAVQKDWSTLFEYLETDSITKKRRDPTQCVLKKIPLEDTIKMRALLGQDLESFSSSKNKSYYRTGMSEFGSMKCIGLWWLFTSSEPKVPDGDDMTMQWSRCEGYDGYSFGMGGLPPDWKNYGFFVRCIKNSSIPAK